MGKKSFKTNTLLKNIIGKDLINSDNIAVLELVKNSFDAGSKKVKVQFLNIQRNADRKTKGRDPNESKIIIQDWGVGMGDDELTHRWLNIAYSEKRRNANQFGRRMAGAKGIGRFSCDRLGRYLDLYTRKSGAKYFHLSLDWHDFETENDPDKRIESVGVDVQEITERDLRAAGHSPFDHGTILEISQARAKWDQVKLSSLRQHLERLINPHSQANRAPFILQLEAPEFNESINGPIQNRFFDRLEFTATSIESSISTDGTTIQTVLRDKGRVIFDLSEKNLHLPLLRGVKVLIYYLNSYGKAYFKRMTGQDKVQFGSIFLFINGFRVPPYGDEKDDWLGIDRYKIQAYGRNLGTREIVGRIEIDDPEGDYKIVSSREGIVRDDRTEELTSRDGFYYLAHRRLESYVVEGLSWDSVPREAALEVQKQTEQKGWKFSPGSEIYSVPLQEKNLSILRSLESTLNVKTDDVVSLTLNTDLIDELRIEEREKADRILSRFSEYGGKLHQSTTRALERVQKLLTVQEKRLENTRQANAQLSSTIQSLKKTAEKVEKENLFLRATVSTDSKEVLALQHQIGLSSKRIEFKLNELRKDLASGAAPEVITAHLNIISLENRKIISVSRFVTKANFSMETRLIEKDLVQFIREYITNVYQEYNEFKINNTRIGISVDGGSVKFVRKFSPLEIIIVIDNMLDNARKARASNVELSFSANGRGALEIRFRDNGHGIPTENLPRLFDFGFTTTDGSGLGLYHVQDIISKMGGKVTVESKDSEGAVFTIRIPK